MSKFKVGIYRFAETDTNRAEEIRVVKITPHYVYFHIVVYHGCSYSLYDVKFRRKIITNAWGGESVKQFYYAWNTIFTPTAQQLNCDSGFDTLVIDANELLEIE